MMDKVAQRRILLAQIDTVNSMTARSGKVKFRHIIGYSLIAGVFGGVIIAGTILTGLVAVAEAFAIAFGIVTILWVGINLIYSD